MPSAGLQNTYQAWATPSLGHILAGQRFLRFFLSPSRFELHVVGLCALVALVAVWGLVEQTGLYVYVHLAYAPIALTALFFGPWGGVAVGVMAGLAVGPFVAHEPLIPSISTDGFQYDELGWLFRTAAFATFGTVAGLIFQFIRRLTSRSLRHSYLDDVTGLPNDQYLRRVLGTMAASDAHASMCIVNIASYRDILGAFGPAFANELARESAHVVAEALPPDALLFALHQRFFAVVHSGATGADLEDDLLRTLSAPVTVRGLPLSPNAALGIVPAGKISSETETVIQRALIASEDAADASVDKLSYTDTREEERQKQIKILSAFRDAVREAQLYVVYQPQVRLTDASIVGCEALVRWRHPERGDISPGVFVPVVERSSLIRDMTEQVMRTALSQAVAWREIGLRLPVAVNLSARLLSRADLVPWVLAIVDDVGATPELLEIEITETAALLEGDAVSANLNALRKADIGLSIDDYGTGMSSLFYLREIPAQTVKIDRTFVTEMHKNVGDRSLVRSTISLCQELGMRTVAEGIEDKETADLLVEFGCDYGQGYFYAKPLVADEIPLFADGLRELR